MEHLVERDLVVVDAVRRIHPRVVRLVPAEEEIAGNNRAGIVQGKSGLLDKDRLFSQLGALEEAEQEARTETAPHAAAMQNPPRKWVMS